ncbi:amidase [Paenibacillus alkalitolerans]|uniref:amidase n=1 Tax=Paenibacillus alkalitolerans TaxID=2799335 RepID=UPI0018F5CE4E|nr:amidase [Paenibacillus alkalitolerans]
MNRYGAYIHEDVSAEPQGTGLLSGLAFAVKDVFDIQGHTCAAGNPDWRKTHAAARGHAAVIRTLLRQGARLRGVTHTDELMYSLNGINHHYGTPVNPNAPDRIPGGSSSGSAVAVASHSADFALGTDTGGSVRIPSSFCGIYGIRPTHGRISAEGVIPLAPSFDTVGWMANTAERMFEIGRVLLDDASAVGEGVPFRSVYVPGDVWSFADPGAMKESDPLVKAIAGMVERSGKIILSDEGYNDWMNAFRVLQGLEIWQCHGEWIRASRPKFGPGIAGRIAWASKLKAGDHEDAFRLRREVRERLVERLGEDSLLLIPTAPGPAPHLGGSTEELELFREKMLSICCIAGLSGLPQINIPVRVPGKPPIGISLIAGTDQDLRLLAFVHEIAREASNLLGTERGPA